MKPEIAKKYNLESGKSYEPHFRHGDAIKGTGIILSFETSARFAEHYKKGNDLIFIPAVKKAK